MKKITLLLTSILLVLTLTCCGGASKDDKKDQGASKPSVESEATESTESVESTPSTEEESMPEVETHIHFYETTIVKATCTTDGYTLNRCSCGDEKKSDEVKSTGHKFGAWVTTKAATETEVGKAERTCEACSNSEKKELAKLPKGHKHEYSKEVVKPTCTTTGYTVYTCNCGDSYTSDTTKKKAHDYNKSVTKPTCTTKGYTTYTCDCGDTYIGDYTDTAAHSYKDTKVAATCTTDGYTMHTCSKCGSSYTDSRVSKKGHSYKVTSDTATCAAAGTKTETCETCGNTQASDSPQLAHGATRTETQAATCGTEGYEKTICTVCDTVISNTTTPKTGNHTWETKVLSEAAKESKDVWGMDYAKYASYTEHNVNACTTCKRIDTSTITQKYTAYEEATIMLGYVNDLRREVYGSNEYDMVIDDTLLELAKIRAKELYTIGFSHYGGTRTNASENILSGGATLYKKFDSWKNSTGHYKNMIDVDSKYFAFATYWPDNTNPSNSYSVQLFWSPSGKELY